MKNILRENMRRFGTKNLNEAPESEYNPFVAMDDIMVNVMATRSETMSTSISEYPDEEESLTVSGNLVVAKTVPGEYYVDTDSLEVIISGRNQQTFACTGAVIRGKKSNGTVDWNNVGRSCEIKLILKDIIDDYVVRLGNKSKVRLIIKSNAEKDPFYLDIDLGNSRFKRTRTPSVTAGPVTTD